MFDNGGGDVPRGGRVSLVLLHAGPGARQRGPALPGQLPALQARWQDTEY